MYRGKGQKSLTWRDLSRSTWRYGLSPRRLRGLVATRLPQTQKLYGAWETVTSNLSKSLSTLGLTDEYKQSAGSYPSSRSIPAEFSRDIVEAAARTHDLHHLNSMSALIAMSTTTENTGRTQPENRDDLRQIRVLRTGLEPQTKSKIAD